MARKKRNGDVDKGRGFFETSSPFETYTPGGEKPKTFSGLTDKLDIPRHLMTGPSGPAVAVKFDPEQYDNPRGYPGLALVTTGTETSKLGGKQTHSITHHMEGGAQLSRTGK